MMQKLLDHPTRSWPLSLSRMMIGVLWLFSLRWKLPPDFVSQTGSGLMDWLLLEVEYPFLQLYADFVETAVIPNFTFFAWLIFLTELAVGLSLLTGTLTRLGAGIGLLMSLNLLIGLLEVPHEWPWSYVMMVMWHGVFLVTAAGRLWGVDGWVRGKRPLSKWLNILT